jgi:hypothetical protein
MVIGTSREPSDCIKISHEKQRIEKTLNKTERFGREKVYASINVYSSCSPLLSEQSIMTGPTYLKK